MYGVVKKQIPERDNVFFEKIEKESYETELGSKEEEELYIKKLSYIREEIPKIDSIERGYFLISKIGTNEEYTREIGELREKIEIKMIELAETVEELQDVYKNSFPTSVAKKKALRKMAEISNDPKILWEVAKITKERSIIKDEDEEQIKSIAIRKMIENPEISRKELFDIKIMLTDDESEEEKMIDEKLNKFN